MSNIGVLCIEVDGSQQHWPKCGKFLLDQGHFKVKLFSEWLESLLIKEIQMLFMSYFTIKTVDIVL